MNSHNLKHFKFNTPIYIALSLGIFSFLIRLLMIHSLDLNYSQCSDFGNYWEFTKRFVESGFIPCQSHISSSYGIYAYYVPLYWLLGGSLNLVLSVNALSTGILFGLLSYVFIKKCSTNFGLAIGVIMALFPSNITAHGLVCSEIPSLFFGLMPILLYAISRKSWIIILNGVFLGFSFMIRPPNIAFLLGALILIMFYKISIKEKFKDLQKLILGFLIFVSPFIYINYQRYGVFKPTQPKTGYILTYLYRNTDYAINLNREDKLFLVEKRKEIYDKFDADQDANPYKYDKMLVDAWLSYFKRHPNYLLNDLIVNAYSLFRDDRGHHYTYTYAKKDNFFIIWDKLVFSKIKPYYEIIFILGCTGIMLFFPLSIFIKKNANLKLSLITIFFGTTFIYLLTFGKNRFHFALIPILTIFTVELISEQIPFLFSFFKRKFIKKT